ncbi:outer membrane protein assembly factor BamA [Marivivens marinus]|uniref:outer membrane protein assembly factor BamA n=1 Tax=Marivivens marinus TaxID=3110173 RepID=UPI003B8450D2
MNNNNAFARTVGFARAFFVFVFIALAALPASRAVAQSFVFSSVQIDGNQRIETATILSYLGVTRGEAVSTADLNDGIQRIRATGLFESVDATPRGNTLLITVVEYPTINRINFEGNRRLSDDELRPLVRSQPRRVYSPSQAEADVAAISQAYADQGRINATVTPRIIRRSDNRVDLVFEVFEGGVTEIERISFVGNREYSDRRLRRVLETKQAGILRAVIQRDTFVADRIEFDKQVLTDFYRSRGYVDFTVQSVDVSLTRQRDAYLITFNVQEGQRYRFGEVTLSSEMDEVDADVFEAALRTRSGDIYSPVAIENDIARLERLALQNNVQFMQVEPRITRNDRDLTLDVEYVLIRGPRIFVERIDIEGNNTTLDRVVRNQFRVVEGDPFNPRSIRESAERIRALGFFGNADVQAREGSSPDQVIVDVNVVEQPTGSLSFGANFNSDNGLSLVASLSQRNWLGRGQSLNFNLSTAETNRLFVFNFAEPNLLGRDLRFGFDVEYASTDNENALYDTEKFTFSPSLTFPIGERSRLGVFYSADYADISDVTTASAPIVADGLVGGLWTNSVGYTYTWDSRRNGLNPTAGVYLRFGQEYGFGDVEFVKTTAVAAAEADVLNEEVTLRATLEGGLLSYTNGNSRIIDRFFLSSRQMRGFNPGGFGPRDALTDDALGGNAYAVARLEAEFPLGLPEEYGMSGGVFFDYGSLWDTGLADTSDVLYNDFTPRSVVGVSLFWTTPIGPLRFNWTEALDAQPQDDPRSFELTVSTTF